MTMKIRRSIFWFVVIVAVLIALVLWHGRKKPVETPPATAVETNAAPPAATRTEHASECAGSQQRAGSEDG